MSWRRHPFRGVASKGTLVARKGTLVARKGTPVAYKSSIVAYKSGIVALSVLLLLLSPGATGCTAGSDVDHKSEPAAVSSATPSSATASSTAASSTALRSPATINSAGPAPVSSAMAQWPADVVAALNREGDAQLAFVKHGKTVRAVTKRTLIDTLKATASTDYDPYYNKPKRFVHVALVEVLKLGFGETEEELSKHHYVLKALDGYTVPLEGNRLLQDGGQLALADVDVPQWQLIGPQQANPGPYYLIWLKPDQHELSTHPRPWQLAKIEIARFEDTFPHTVPGDSDDDSAAWRGYRLFREQCIRCHAINREGGRVGPELNVPQSIVEYRPGPQIRAYIKNPLSFRYGNMPQNPHLTDADLDNLLAYFTSMKARKYNPDAKNPDAKHAGH